MVESVELAVELGAYLPTQPGPGGLGVVRLVPSVHAALPLDRFLFRTRQGLFVDLADTEDAGWVSAYGVDVEVIGPLVVGAELDFSLGQEARDLLVLATLGGHVSLAFEHVVVSIAGRGGLGDSTERVLGAWGALSSLEIGGW